MVEPGYETALAAALGDDIEASADEGAPIHWRGLPPLADTAALPGVMQRPCPCMWMLPLPLPGC